MTNTFICITCKSILSDDHAKMLENAMAVKEAFGEHVDDINNTDLMCADCFTSAMEAEDDD